MHKDLTKSVEKLRDAATEETASIKPQTPAARSPISALTSGPLLRILAFFFLLAVLAFGLDQVFTFGLRRIKSSDFGVSNKIMAGQVNAQIVISGSSRAVCHYDPRILEQVTGLKTFNIGRNGSQTDMQLAVLKAYLRHNTKPRLVIHNLDAFSFVTTREVYNPGQYLPYLDEPDIYQALLKVNPSVWKWKYIPLYRYVVEDMRFTWILGAKGILGLGPREDYLQGFRPERQRWTGDFERFKSLNPDGIRFEIEPQGTRDFEELISLCRRQGIPVLLVYSPVYYEMRGMERNHGEVFSRFHELGGRWDAEIWDYSDSPICGRRELFYNSQHLNEEGAGAFSAALAARLITERPWESEGHGVPRTRGPIDASVVQGQ